MFIKLDNSRNFWKIRTSSDKASRWLGTMSEFSISEINVFYYFVQVFFANKGEISTSQREILNEDYKHRWSLLSIKTDSFVEKLFFCILWIFSKSILHEGSGAGVVACFSQVSASETVGSTNDASFSAFTRTWSKAQIWKLINFSVFDSLQDLFRKFGRIN